MSRRRADRRRSTAVQPVPRSSARGVAGDGADRRRDRAFYAYTIYMQKFLANTSGFDRATASRIMTVALALHAADPAARRAAVATASGGKPLMIFFGVGGDPVHLSDLRRRWRGTNSVAAAFALVMAALVIVTGYTSINAIMKAELFPGRHPRARRRAAVCDRQHDLRRHGRICRALAQGHRPRALVLHLHLGARRAVADRLRPDARDQDDAA